MKSVLNYLDYQEYLRDWYQHRKTRDSYFSFRLMGSKIGIDAGFLLKILQGKLHLPIKSISNVAHYLRLDDRESNYFELLVRYGRAKDEKEIKLLFEKVAGFSAGKSRAIQTWQYEFYHKWYYAAIHAMLSFYKFKDDYIALARKLNPQITASQARAAIVLLNRLELIAQNEAGVWEPTAKFLTTGEKWSAPAIAQYQEEAIELAKSSLQRDEKAIRDISTVTLAISHKDLAEIKARAADFRRGLLALDTGNEPADCVYQVNIQVIPLTKIKEDEHE